MQWNNWSHTCLSGLKAQPSDHCLVCRSSLSINRASFPGGGYSACLLPLPPPHHQAHNSSAASAQPWVTTPGQGPSPSSEPIFSMPSTPKRSRWCQPAAEGSLDVGSRGIAGRRRGACFSSDLTAPVEEVSSNLLKGCSVAECIGVSWWKALGFWGVCGTFLWKLPKVSPQLFWNPWDFSTVKELRWMSYSRVEKQGFENHQVPLKEQLWISSGLYILWGSFENSKIPCMPLKISLPPSLMLRSSCKLESYCNSLWEEDLL